MMYSGVVGRTQVYLTEKELELLDRAGQASGASRSELIRRAVRAAFGDGDGSERLAAVQQAAGIWQDRRFTGAQYVDAIRGDLNERLRRLGIDT